MTFRCSFMAHNIVCPAIQRPTYHKRICFQTFPPDDSYAIHSHEAGLYLFQAVSKNSHHQGIFHSYLPPRSRVLEALFTSLRSGLPEPDGPAFFEDSAMSAYPDITAVMSMAIRVLFSPHRSLGHISCSSPSKIYHTTRLKHD